jgi:hypothetical protein
MGSLSITAICCSLGALLPSIENPATPPAVATPTPATTPINIDLLMGLALLG